MCSHGYYCTHCILYFHSVHLCYVECLPDCAQTMYVHRIDLVGRGDTEGEEIIKEV